MKRMELLYCHEQLGIVLPMLSAFIVLEFEFLHVCDQKWSIVIDYEKTFIIIMDLFEKQRQKHVTFEQLFLRIFLILMA